MYPPSFLSFPSGVQKNDRWFTWRILQHPHGIFFSRTGGQRAYSFDGISRAAPGSQAAAAAVGRMARAPDSPFRRFFRLTDGDEELGPGPRASPLLCARGPGGTACRCSRATARVSRCAPELHSPPLQRPGAPDGCSPKGATLRNHALIHPPAVNAAEAQQWSSVGSRFAGGMGLWPTGPGGEGYLAQQVMRSGSANAFGPPLR